MSLLSDLLLAETGVLPDEITPADYAAAETMVPSLTRKIGALVRSQEPEEMKYREPPANPEKLLTKLAEPLDRAETVDRWFSGLDVREPDLVGEYWVSLARARSYLDKTYPRTEIDVGAGPELVALDWASADEWYSLFQVLDDPARLLDDALAWALTPSQALAFRYCYPDLYKLLADTALKEAAKHAHPPVWEVQDVLKIFNGLQPEAIVTTPPPPPEQPAPAKKTEASTEALTPGQAADRVAA